MQGMETTIQKLYVMLYKWLYAFQILLQTLPYFLLMTFMLSKQELFPCLTDRGIEPRETTTLRLLESPGTLLGLQPSRSVLGPWTCIDVSLLIFRLSRVIATGFHQDHVTIFKT